MVACLYHSKFIQFSFGLLFDTIHFNSIQFGSNYCFCSVHLEFWIFHAIILYAMNQREWMYVCYSIGGFVRKGRELTNKLSLWLNLSTASNPLTCLNLQTLLLLDKRAAKMLCVLHVLHARLLEAITHFEIFFFRNFSTIFHEFGLNNIKRNLNK